MKQDLREAFAAGFEEGRKVLCHYGRPDLDARIEKGYREWLRLTNTHNQKDALDLEVEKAMNAPCPGCHRAPAKTNCICIPF